MRSLSTERWALSLLCLPQGTQCGGLQPPLAMPAVALPPCCHPATRQSCPGCAPVLEMLETGRQVLERMHPGAKLRFGFHRPPFNSVLHLQ